MALRILLYFGLLAVGWLLSSKGLIHNNLMKKISGIQAVILFGLIYVMGVRVGMDEQVLSSIGKIGLTAAVFAAITVAFSILFVYLLRKKLFSDKRIVGGSND
ncbi:DUF340 domain-containing protein [Sedimentibacter sp.]|uniref:DUF340 domain-containing protein n=1 Tax=Sedimentibacter sp. TaxID=1960295 RepID=UPI0028A86C76|nr:DUF340 domain-containing protein [Sedimentibacter sp.]